MNILHRPAPDLSWLSELERFFNTDRTIATHTQSTDAIHESSEAWFLRLDVPGFKKENVKLSVENQTLSLSAETTPENPFTRKFNREWKIGSRIDTASIKATLENGILEITLPKIEAPEPRQISIQ
jgi:HSP20 family protein